MTGKEALVPVVEELLELLVGPVHVVHEEVEARAVLGHEASAHEVAHDNTAVAEVDDER